MTMPAVRPPRLHYFGNERGWIKNTYAAIREFISKPAVEPIAAAVRTPEKPQSSTDGAQCQRRLNIPQFPPVENSPLRRLKNPQAQKDCKHAPAQ